MRKNCIIVSYVCIIVSQNYIHCIIYPYHDTTNTNIENNKTETKRKQKGIETVEYSVTRPRQRPYEATRSPFRPVVSHRTKAFIFDNHCHLLPSSFLAVSVPNHSHSSTTFSGGRQPTSRPTRQVLDVQVHLATNSQRAGSESCVASHLAISIPR